MWTQLSRRHHSLLYQALIHWRLLNLSKRLRLQQVLIGLLSQQGKKMYVPYNIHRYHYPHQGLYKPSLRCLSCLCTGLLPKRWQVSFGSEELCSLQQRGRMHWMRTTLLIDIITMQKEWTSGMQIWRVIPYLQRMLPTIHLKWPTLRNWTM